MANAGIVIGWSDPKVSREKDAAELWMSSLAFYQTKVDDGTIESFEPVIMGRHGGDLNGFILIRGDQAKLDAFKRSDEFMDLTLKGIHCLAGFGIVGAHLGEGLASLMQKWVELVQGS
jgi:hypothetical protein